MAPFAFKQGNTWASRGILFWQTRYHSSAPASIKQAASVRTRPEIILTLKLHKASLNLPFFGFDDALSQSLWKFVFAATAPHSDRVQLRTDLVFYGGARGNVTRVRPPGTKQDDTEKVTRAGQKFDTAEINNGMSVIMDSAWSLAFSYTQNSFENMWWIHRTICFFVKATTSLCDTVTV